MEQFPERTLQPVELIEDFVTRDRDLISMITPDGFRFEGLAVASAAALWERIR